MKMFKKEVNFIELANQLKKINVPTSYEDLKGCTSKGTCSAKIFVQCLYVLKVESPPFENIEGLIDKMSEDDTMTNRLLAKNSAEKIDFFTIL